MDMSTVEQIWLYIALALNFFSACYLQLPQSYNLIFPSLEIDEKDKRSLVG